jgi:toxin ParE1/3/4
VPDGGNRRIILAPVASLDISDALRWSERRFGAEAAQRYRELMRQALRDIGSDPERLGSKARPDLLIAGARTYHIAFSRRRSAGATVKDPRHFLLYRQCGDAVEVARVLYDSRDLERHLPADYRRAEQG